MALALAYGAASVARRARRRAQRADQLRRDVGDARRGRLCRRPRAALRGLPGLAGAAGRVDRPARAAARRGLARARLGGLGGRPAARAQRRDARGAVPAAAAARVWCCRVGRVGGRRRVGACTCGAAVARARARLRSVPGSGLLEQLHRQRLPRPRRPGRGPARSTTLWLWISVAGGVLVAAFAGRRLLAATRPARAASWSVLVPAALAALAEAALRGRPAARSSRGSRGRFARLPRPRARIHAARRRGSRGRSSGSAARGPRSCGWRTTSVRRPSRARCGPRSRGSLGDPGARPWCTRCRARARTSTPKGGSSSPHDRSTTPIVRNGEPVALVIHDRALSEARGARASEPRRGWRSTTSGCGPRPSSQLVDLRASRARIVEAGDAARRRIERDLHDGAQQRLLTALVRAAPRPRERRGRR